MHLHLLAHGSQIRSRCRPRKRTTLRPSPLNPHQRLQNHPPKPPIPKAVRLVPRIEPGREPKPRLHLKPNDQVRHPCQRRRQRIRQRRAPRQGYGEGVEGVEARFCLGVELVGEKEGRGREGVEVTEDREKAGWVCEGEGVGEEVGVDFEAEFGGEGEKEGESSGGGARRGR